MSTYSSIPAMVQASAARWEDRPAIVDGDVVLTFRDVERTMLRVAASLIARGIERGDRVAIWAPNSATWVPAALGIHAVGAWLVPVNTRFRGAEAAQALERVDASLLIAVDEFLGVDYLSMVRAEGGDLRSVRSMVSLPPPGATTCPGWESFLDEGSAVDAREVQARIDAITPDDVSDIILTSGTTGYPKGVMLRHGASLDGYTSYADAFQLGADSRQIVITPFFHCFGYKAGWMVGLMQGSTTFPIAAFDAGQAIQVISSQRITHMAGSPTMFSAILDHPERAQFDLSSLQSTLMSASTIPESLVRRVRDELGVISTLTGYGLTENHAIVSLSRPSDSPNMIATTAGRVLDGIGMRVVDDDGHDVETGTEGELLLSGHLQMSGYFDDPEATAEAIVDGWLHTGDMVRVDDNRYLTITDRKKDIYIMGGFNVAPAEVERVLLECEGVAAVAVIGVPDEYFGEVGAAFVVRDADGEVESEDVIQFARQRLANYKVPRSVEIVDALPLNATGKVLKHVLRAEHEAARVVTGA